jgi:recombination protein RecA
MAKKKETPVGVEALRSTIMKNNDGIIDLSADEFSTKDLGFIPIGIPEIDDRMGGGFARGRLTEVFGKEASGKSSLWEQAVGNVIAEDGFALVQEVEVAYEEDRIRQILLKKPNIIAKMPEGKELSLEEWHMEKAENPELFDPCSLIMFSHPGTMEEAVAEIEDTLRTIEDMGEIDFPTIIVTDSIASLSTETEQSKEVGEMQYSSHAIILSRALRKTIIKLAAKTKTALVFINQVRTNMKAMPGQDPYVTFGGKSVAFYATTRIQVSKLGKFTKGEGKNKVAAGQWSEVKLVKSKVFGVAPHTKSKFLILYDGGPSSSWGMFEYLKTLGLIKAAGSNGSKIDGLEDKYFTKDTWDSFYLEHRKYLESLIYMEEE